MPCLSYVLLMNGEAIQDVNPFNCNISALQDFLFLFFQNKTYQ